MRASVEPKCRKCAEHALHAYLLANVFLVIFKGAIGFFSGSLAVTADAIHSAADVLDSVITLIAVKLGKKPADKSHPYGHGKTEFIAGAFIGVVLLIGASAVIVVSVAHLVRSVPHPRPHFIALAAALVSIGINEMLFRRGICAARKVNSAAIEAEAWDNRADSLSSIPVFIGVLGAQFGFLSLDPLAALFVGILVGKIGFQLLNKNLQGLMDAPLHSEETSRIRELVVAVPGVRGIGYLRTRGVGRNYLADLQILVNARTTVGKSDAIAREVRSVLRRQVRHLEHVTVVCKPHSDGREEKAQ